MPSLDLWFGSENSAATPAGPAKENILTVRTFSVQERVSGLFEVAIMAMTHDADLDFEAIVGQPAGFRIQSGVLHASGGGTPLEGHLSLPGADPGRDLHQGPLDVPAHHRPGAVAAHPAAREPRLPAPDHPRYRRQAARRVVDQAHLEDRPRRVSKAGVPGPVRGDGPRLLLPPARGGRHRLHVPGRRAPRLRAHPVGRAPGGGAAQGLSGPVCR